MLRVFWLIMGVAASIAARSPCEISTRAARRRMMYNSQIQRLHSFHRLPAQAVEACARLSESGASQCPCLPAAAEGTSHDVMSAYVKVCEGGYHAPLAI